MHFQAEISAPCHFYNVAFVIFTVHFDVHNGSIRKFLWGGRLGGFPPQLSGRGGDRPHGVGAYGLELDVERVE